MTKTATKPHEPRKLHKPKGKIKHEHFQVSFIWGGTKKSNTKSSKRSGIRFGIAQMHSSGHESHSDAGKLVVECAVGVDSYCVYESDLTDYAMSFGSFHKDYNVFWGGGPYEDYVALCNMAHQVREAKLTGDKLQVHHQFSIGVADGSANYVVVKVNKKTCDVEWRGWCADRYYDHHFGSGGRFPIDEVSRYVRPGQPALFESDNSPSGSDLFDLFQQAAAEYEESYPDVPIDHKHEYLKVF